MSSPPLRLLHPTERFTISETLIDVSYAHKIRQSTEVESLKLRNVRSEGWVRAPIIHLSSGPRIVKGFPEAAV